MCHTRQIFPAWFLGIFNPQEAFPWSSICVKQWSNQQNPQFFNGLPQAEFEKAIKVKCADKMKLCIVNEGRYFEKALIKKTECELEDSEE